MTAVLVVDTFVKPLRWGTVANPAIGSGVEGGSFDIKQLLTAPFVVVGFAAAAEQPFGDQ